MIFCLLADVFCEEKANMKEVQSLTQEKKVCIFVLVLISV